MTKSQLIGALGFACAPIAWAAWGWFQGWRAKRTTYRRVTASPQQRQALSKAQPGSSEPR